MTDINRLRLVGPDTAEWVPPVWDDLRFSATQVAVTPATNKPDRGAFPPGATHTKTLLFDGASEETVTFDRVIPHTYRLGSDLNPHVHWSATSVELAKTVRWDLHYHIVKRNAAFGSVTTITATFSGDTVLSTHTVTEWADIDGSGIDDVGFLLYGALSRRGDLDTYTGDVAFFELDFHYEKQYFGSRSRFAP